MNVAVAEQRREEVFMSTIFCMSGKYILLFLIDKEYYIFFNKTLQSLILLADFIANKNFS